MRALMVSNLIVVCPAMFLGCEPKSPPPVPVAASPNAAESVRHVDAEGGAKLLAGNPGVVVLDVRTPGEFGAGHLAGAKNIDFNESEFGSELAKLDRDKTYLVHCGAGGRSTRALETFQKLGFKSVVHLDGGYNAWVQAGKPVEK